MDEIDRIIADMQRNIAECIRIVDEMQSDLARAAAERRRADRDEIEDLIRDLKKGG